VNKDDQSEDEQISTTEAAERLNISRKRVHQLIEEKSFQQKRSGRFGLSKQKICRLSKIDLQLEDRRKAQRQKTKKNNSRLL
jgi:excisionase family DNA binding protein